MSTASLRGVLRPSIATTVYIRIRVLPPPLAGFNQSATSTITIAAPIDAADAQLGSLG